MSNLNHAQRMQIGNNRFIIMISILKKYIKVHSRKLRSDSYFIDFYRYCHVFDDSNVNDSVYHVVRIKVLLTKFIV